MPGTPCRPATPPHSPAGSAVWVWDGDWLRGQVVGIAGPKLRVRLLDSGDERDCNASDIPLQNSSAAGVEVSRWLEAGGRWAARSEPPPCVHWWICSSLHVVVCPIGRRGAGSREQSPNHGSAALLACCLAVKASVADQGCADARTACLAIQYAQQHTRQCYREQRQKGAAWRHSSLCSFYGWQRTT